MESSWNTNLTNVLEKIRLNSIFLSEKHRARYQEYTFFSKWFDLPTIILSVFSSSFISLNAVPSARTQIITTLISMAIAISTSIKLYLNLAALITQEVLLSKEFYSLAIEIMKVLSLRESDRNIDGIVFLNECYNTYKQLVEASTLLKTNIRRDELVRITHIDTSYMSGSDTSSVSSDESPKTSNILVRDHNEL
jgi:hypothetical protein